MGFHDGVAPEPHRTRKQIHSKYDSGTLPFSSSAISLLLPAVDYCRLSLPPTSTPILRLVVCVRHYLRLSIRLLHERDGSKMHRRGLPTNSGGEWLGTRSS